MRQLSAMPKTSIFAHGLLSTLAAPRWMAGWPTRCLSMSAASSQYLLGSSPLRSGWWSLSPLLFMQSIAQVPGPGLRRSLSMAEPSDFFALLCPAIVALPSTWPRAIRDRWMPPERRGPGRHPGITTTWWSMPRAWPVHSIMLPIGRAWRHGPAGRVAMAGVEGRKASPGQGSQCGPGDLLQL
jgi:hypothetical protein